MKLSRRAMLKGAGGVAVALPFLEGMMRPRSAAAAGAIPKRLVVFYKPDGYSLDEFWPVGTETSFRMAGTQAALEPHKQDLIVIDGLQLPEFHTNAIGGMLTGQPLNPGPFIVPNTTESAGWAKGISVDQAVANHLAAQGVLTKFKSLELGVQTGMTDQGATNAARMSYLGSDQPVTPEDSPYTAFDRIFASQIASQAAVQKLRAQRGTVLNAVMGEYQQLKGKVGAADAQKLDAHLTSIREIETRLSTAAPGSTPACQIPQRGTPIDVGANNNYPLIGKLQMDLLVMSLACDLTRVGSLMWSNSLTGTNHTWCSGGVHHYWVHQDPVNNADARGRISRINTWYAEQFAYFLAKMKSVKEADGSSLLDHTVVVWCQEMALGHTHSADGVPFMLAGNLGGQLRTGRYLKYPSKPRNNNLLVSILNAFGSNVTTFGKPDWCTGPLAGLV